MTRPIPGYYNHCAVCGRTASGHHPRFNESTGKYDFDPYPDHDFVMRDDEGVMGSPAPTWQDFWELQRRVEELERRVINEMPGIAIGIGNER